MFFYYCYVIPHGFFMEFSVWDEMKNEFSLFDILVGFFNIAHYADSRSTQQREDKWVRMMHENFLETEAGKWAQRWKFQTIKNWVHDINESHSTTAIIFSPLNH